MYCRQISMCINPHLNYKPSIYVSWSKSELRVRLAQWNQFKRSSKIFYWPFQGGTSFVDLLCFFLSWVCYAFVPVCLFVPCGHLLGRGWLLGFRFWCLTVRLSLSHWYLGSGVVLDCIESWSLHTYLLFVQKDIMNESFFSDKKQLCIRNCWTQTRHKTQLKPLYTGNP